jgi:aminoglycoside phosphotransferase (APT) family kinase protein
VHGDSHLGNVLATAGGPLWGDWEDAFLGPAGWDLACLLAPAQVFGEAPERGLVALAAYGATVGDEELDVLVRARAVQLAAWTVVIVARHPQRAFRLAPQLAWLRRHAT